jgi:hypothetical protein
MHLVERSVSFETDSHTADMNARELSLNQAKPPSR